MVVETKSVAVEKAEARMVEYYNTHTGEHKFIRVKDGDDIEVVKSTNGIDQLWVAW